MPETLKTKVTPECVDLRADKALTLLFEGCTRNQIQKALQTGQICLDDLTPIKPNQKLIPGQTLIWNRPDPKPLLTTPLELPLDIIFQDQFIAVINKPQGLAVHPSLSDEDPNLVQGLLYHLDSLAGIGGVIRPGIVHRIDKNTSGLLVVAKSDEAHQYLAKLFETHTIERKYLALVYGSPSWSQTTIKTLIGRSPSDRKKMSAQVKTGKQAISHFKVIERFGYRGRTAFASLIEAELQTGRTHQIRVHLTELGHSIIGDPVYGCPSPTQKKWKDLPKEAQELIKNLPGQALHAQTLGFTHPKSGQKLHFEVAPPELFLRLKTLLSNV